MAFAARRFTKLIQLGRAFTSEGRPVSMTVGFNDSRVQKHLQAMTGLEFERVFRFRKQELSMPVYNLLTEEELQKVCLCHFVMLQVSDTLQYSFSTGTTGSTRGGGGPGASPQLEYLGARCIVSIPGSTCTIMYL